MRIKSYFANSVEAALIEAQRELGSDAVLIQSKKSPDTARHLGEYEVVFGLTSETDRVSAQPPAERRANAPSHGLSSEMAELRRQIDEMRSALRMPVSTPAAAAHESHPVYRALLDADVSSTIARELLQAAMPERAVTSFNRTASEPDPERMRTAMTQWIREKCLVVDPTRNERTPVLAFTGPNGCGKSTLIAKIALRHGLLRRRTVSIICADTRRVAAAEPLKSYAAIIGVRFTAVESLGELLSAMEAAKQRDLVLIDTPGFAPAEREAAADLAYMLGQFPDISTHLVLPASARTRDSLASVERFSCFRPSTLSFTRLDETDVLGSVISVAMKTGLPLSYFTDGPSIPENLSAADPVRAIDQVFNSEELESRFAA